MRAPLSHLTKSFLSSVLQALNDVEAVEGMVAEAASHLHKCEEHLWTQIFAFFPFHLRY